MNNKLKVDTSFDSIVSTEMYRNSQRYKALKQNTPLSFLELDMDGNIQYFNHYFELKSNVLLKDFKGVHFSKLPMLASNQNYLKFFFKKLVRRAKSDSVLIDWIDEFNNKRYSLIHFSIVVFSAAEKEIQIVIEDYTEIKEKEEELLNAKIKAEESERLKTAFLANMSHEVRTPLNGIVGFLSLLKKHFKGNAEAVKYIDYIDSSSTNLLQIITDIVEISKLEIGMVPIANLMFNINSEFENLFNFYKKEILEKKSSVQIYYNKSQDSENFSIFADRAKIMRIINILIHNAIKFTDRGLVEFGYYFKTNPTHNFLLNYLNAIDSKNEKSIPNSEQYIVFYVKDSGIGISEEKRKHIFDSFTKNEDSFKQVYGGNGLGLAIASALVDVMNGNISVESELNAGSLFTFSIPIEKPIRLTKDKQATS